MARAEAATDRRPATHRKPRGPALVAVADSVRARLFLAATPQSPLRELESLVNPEGRLHEGDLVSDDAGRRYNRPTQAERSAFGGQTAKRHRAEDFAGEVCEHLATALHEQNARRVYIMAEPEFLGLLRMRIDDDVRDLIVSSEPLSVAGETPNDIRARLPEEI